MAEARFDMAQWMDPAANAAFASCAARRSYAAGQTVYYQDDPGTEMYRVISGSIRLSSRQPDGREVVFLLFGANDFFGASSLVDARPRPQTAECLTPVELDVLSARDFAWLRAQHSTFTDALLRLLAQQMRVVSGRYARASLTALPGRVAERMIELAIADHDVDGTPALIFRLAQAELAAMVGASRQSVNKVLQLLQAHGAIRIAPREIALLDVAALTRLIAPS